MNPIYEYDDYRKFLRDFCDHKKQTTRAFTFRKFADQAGLASHMHLQLVMKGQRNLSNRSIQKFARGLRLKTKEAEYFEALVYFGQSKATEEKALYLDRLQKMRSKPSAYLLKKKEDQSLFSKTYLVPLYELVQHRDFQEDPKWICRKLRRILTEAEAKEGLLILEEIGLAFRNENGQLQLSHSRIAAEDEIENLLRRRYHLRMMELAARRFDDPLGQRELGFVTVCTTRERFEALKRKIKSFIQESNATATLTKSEGEAVYQLNVQLFELTDPNI